MTNTMNRKKTWAWVAISSVIIICVARWMPHPPNFTPLVGAAVFGAAVLFRKLWAIALPIIALWISDLLLNNILYTQYYDGFIWFNSSFVWSAAALLIIVFVAGFLKNKWTISKVAGASVGSSIIFFLISNFGVWMSMIEVYPRSTSGLLTAYIAGLPFLLNGLAGDMFYCAVFFGSFVLYQKWIHRTELSI